MWTDGFAEWTGRTMSLVHCHRALDLNVISTTSSSRTTSIFVPRFVAQGYDPEAIGSSGETPSAPASYRSDEQNP
jgi:hypothetical protein